MPEWLDNAKNKVRKGYGTVKDSKAFAVAKKTTIGAGGGALKELSSVKGIAGVVTSGGGTLATGAVRGGLSANGIQNSGVDKALSIAGGGKLVDGSFRQPVDPRTALELTTRGGGGLVRKYRETQASDEAAFPKAADASTTGGLQQRTKNNERQIKLADPNGTYGTAVRLEQGKKEHQIHDTLTVNDRERADKDHHSYTTHRRRSWMRGGFRPTVRKTNEQYSPEIYEVFNPLTSALTTRVWLALRQAKDTPGVWLAVPEGWTDEDQNQIKMMCKIQMGDFVDGKNPMAIKFVVAINEFMVAIDTKESQQGLHEVEILYPGIRGGIYSLTSSSGTMFLGYDGKHWAPHGNTSSGSSSPFANLPCRTLIEPYADGAGFRWVKGGPLYKLSELHLHGRNGESDWMLTTEEAGKL